MTLLLSLVVIFQIVLLVKVGRLQKQVEKQQATLASFSRRMSPSDFDEIKASEDFYRGRLEVARYYGEHHYVPDFLVEEAMQYYKRGKYATGS